MAIITPGIAATILAPTAEGQLFQLMQWWQMQEENQSINPNGQEYFTGIKGTDTGNKFFEGTWKIPASLMGDSVNTLFTVSPSIVYPGLTFTPGTTVGTFTATTPAAYTLQVILWLITLENNSQSNPDNFEYITAKFDANAGMYEGSFKIPFITTLLANGGTQDVARPYLL